MSKWDKSNYSLNKSSVKNNFKSLIEAYNILERRVKINDKRPFHRKIFIILLIILD